MRGLAVDFGAELDEEDEALRTGHEWTPDRTVRGEVLGRIVTEASSAGLRDVSLSGIRVVGSFDLTFQPLKPILNIRNCYFAEPITLQSADLQAFFLSSSRVSTLIVDRTHVAGDLVVEECGSIEGGIQLSGAVVGGDLVLSKIHLPDHGAEAVLRADQARITGQLILRGLNLAGTAVFRGSTVESDLTLQDCTFQSNWTSAALVGENLIVGGYVHLSGCRSMGEIRFDKLVVQGEFGCHECLLSAPGGHALSLDNAQILGSVHLLQVAIEGSLRLVGAQIGTDLILGDMYLSNPVQLSADHGETIVADGIQVQGRILFEGECRSAGVARLEGAKAQAVICTGAEIDTLDLQYADISGTVDLRTSRPIRVLRLSGAKVQHLVDDVETWPLELSLDGLTYDDIESTVGGDGVKRIDWIRRQARFSPEPYEQLARFYISRGQTAAAAKISIARHRDANRHRGIVARLWSGMLFAVNGYGYRPWYSVGWLTLLLSLGTLVFSLAHPGEMRPAKPQSEMPPFQPTIYTLDLLIPAIVSNLGQRDAWIAHGAAQWWKLGFTVAGWLFAAVLVNAVSEALKRRG